MNVVNMKSWELKQLKVFQQINKYSYGGHKLKKSVSHPARLYSLCEMEMVPWLHSRGFHWFCQCVVLFFYFFFFFSRLSACKNKYTLLPLPGFWAVGVGTVTKRHLAMTVPFSPLSIGSALRSIQTTPCPSKPDLSGCRWSLSLSHTHTHRHWQEAWSHLVHRIDLQEEVTLISFC